MLEYQIDKDRRPARSPAARRLDEKDELDSPAAANPAGFAWGVDYAQLFNSTFAARYVPDPAHPGQFLTLCSCRTVGLVHDVWMVFDPDDGDAARRDPRVGADLRSESQQDRQIGTSARATAASIATSPLWRQPADRVHHKASRRRRVASFMARVTAWSTS